MRLGVAGFTILGSRGLLRRAAAETRQREDDARYQTWLETHTPCAKDLVRLKAEVAGLVHQPRISIVTAVFNTNPEWLRRCVESVRAQVYPNWELCLCDDGSTNAETVSALQAFANDERIRIVRSAVNGGIVQASNAALTVATGEFVGFLDHDDELAPDALAEVVRRLNAEPDFDIVYTDEDKIDGTGVRSQPHFKPDWSPELLRSCMYTSHFTVMRRRLVEAIGAFREGTDGAQDYDLMLRAMEASPRIAHTPKVLYHWRMASTSAAASRLEKPWAIAAGRRALEDHLRRQRIDAEVMRAEAAGHYRVRYAIAGTPLVSILIPALTSENDKEGFSDWLHELKGRIHYPHHDLLVAPGNTLNAMAHAARGEHLVVMSALATPLRPDWIETLLEFSQQSDIGAVGGLVLFSDGTIDNAGLVLGGSGVPLPAFRGEPCWTRGHLSNILDVRDCAALSATCFMTRRSVFQEVDGLDERSGSAFNIDYCLRLRRAGLRVVVTPHAQFRHPWPALDELSSRDLEYARATWRGALDRDPYYNPNFEQNLASFRLPDRTEPPAFRPADTRGP